MRTRRVHGITQTARRSLGQRRRAEEEHKDQREEGCLLRRAVEGAPYLVLETGRGGLRWPVEVKSGEESAEHPGGGGVPEGSPHLPVRIVKVDTIRPQLIQYLSEQTSINFTQFTVEIIN